MAHQDGTGRKPDEDGQWPLRDRLGRFREAPHDPEVKVTIMCNPHNPGGRVWTRDELTRYGQLCNKHNIIVLSDEIHCDFVSKGHKYTPFATLDDKNLVDNSITFKSGSKSFSLAAMKCAWFFATDPASCSRQVQCGVPPLGLQSGDRVVAGGLCRRRGLAQPVRRLHRRQSGLSPMTTSRRTCR